MEVGSRGGREELKRTVETMSREREGCLNFSSFPSHLGTVWLPEYGRLEVPGRDTGTKENVNETWEKLFYYGSNYNQIAL